MLRLLSSRAGRYLNFMNPCKGAKNTSHKYSFSCDSSFAVTALVYIALVLAVAAFNPLFMEVLRINKWIHELDPEKGRAQIYAGMKIGPL